MHQLIESYKKNKFLHHAYLLEGGLKTITEIINFLKKEVNFNTQNNQNFFQERFDNFGIDEARKIKDLQSKKSTTEDKQIFILQINSITSQAQNALLKVFEEPASATHFFIIVPSVDVLLPTLRSRLMLIGNKIEEDKETLDLVENFLSQKPAQRLELIKNLLEDKTKSIFFLKTLRGVFRQKLDMNNLTKDEAFAIKEILKAENYIQTPSSSVKMLLEFISLIVPVI
jgi:DNA polymerase III delta prime subunit